MTRAVRWVLVSLAGALVFCGTANAQITAGIRGTVTDPSGAAVVGASVTATNEATGFVQTSTSDASGVYTLTLLPVGSYRLSVKATGFKAYNQTGILLSTNQVLGLNVNLELGQATQSVEVRGGPTVVNTQTTEISTLIDAQQIEELPLNGRNPIQLATMTNGVTNSTIETVIKGNDARATNFLGVNGNLENMTEYQLDGVEYDEPALNGGVNYPNPDALQEFRFITNNYSAEFGKNPGGVMEVITKSGSNQLHGDAWEFNRNSDLVSRPFFQPKVPFLNQNQFGFDVGGPVRKDKIFLFGSAQWLRIRGGRATSGAFPATAAERQGDFSGDSVTPVDPTTGLAYPNNTLPSGSLDPVAMKYLNLIPMPNGPGGSFAGSFSEPTNNYQFLIKPDWIVSSKQRLSGSFFMDRTATTSLLDYGRFNLPFINTTGNPAEGNEVHLTNIIANHIYTISPNVLNNFRASYFKLFLDDAAPGRGPTMQQLGSNYPTFPLQDIPNISPSGRWFQGTGNFTSEHSYALQFSDDVSYIRGNHSLKFGGGYRYSNYQQVSTYNDPGIFLVEGSYTGNPLADMMLGHSLLYASNNGVQGLTQPNYDAYVQDEYKVSRKLVANLGVRWQAGPMWTSYPNTLSTPSGGGLATGICFNQGQQSVVYTNAPPGITFPHMNGFGVGDPGCTANLTSNDWHDFAPRVGLAWDVHGDGKTAIRAGWGLFFHTPQEDEVSDSAIGPPSFVNGYVPLTANFTNPIASLVGVFPLAYTQTLSFANFEPMALFLLSPHLTDADIQQFNFTVQHQFGKYTSVQAAYVGNVAQHLVEQREINPPIPYSSQQIATAVATGTVSTLLNGEDKQRIFNQSFLPNTPYDVMAQNQSVGNSAYNGLQLQATVRASHGLSLLGSYAWSKAIDYFTYLITTGTDAGYGQNPHDYHAERGLSGNNRTNVFTTSIVYDTPSVTKALNFNNSAAKQVLDSWELTTIITAEGGNPFTVSTGTDNSLTGEGFDRPNQIGNPHLSGLSRSEMLQRDFNTAAYVANPIGTFGNVGRDTLIGPGLFDVDFGVFKNLPIHEKMKLQLRFEAFNLFNRPNFGQPVSSLNAAAFGQITTAVAGPAGAGRIIQIGGKFTF